jgi:hypothetical protein
MLTKMLQKYALLVFVYMFLTPKTIILFIQSKIKS